MKLKYVKLKDVNSPKFQTKGAACFDLEAAEDMELNSGETKLISTGLAFDIPVGYELVIRPRSGLTLKTNLLVNIGTIDNDYKKEVFIIASNKTDMPVSGFSDPINKVIVTKGQRIAQAKFQKAEQPELIEVNSITQNDRGGFGSTDSKEVDIEDKETKKNLKASGERGQAEGNTTKGEKPKQEASQGKQDSKVRKQDT